MYKQKKQNNAAALVIIFGAILLFGGILTLSYLNSDIHWQSDGPFISIGPLTISNGQGLTVTIDLHVEAEGSPNPVNLTDHITQTLEGMSTQTFTSQGSIDAIQGQLVNQLNQAGHQVSNVFISDISTH